jgi:hypothetical protein
VLPLPSWKPPPAVEGRTRREKAKSCKRLVAWAGNRSRVCRSAGSGEGGSRRRRRGSSVPSARRSPMALSAARRLCSSSATAATLPAQKLSSVFTPRQKPKPRQLPPDSGAKPPAPKLSSIFATRQKPKPRPPPPDSGNDPPPRKPGPRPRMLWEEEAAALLRRLHEGLYLPGPDYSSVPHACSPDTY